MVPAGARQIDGIAGSAGTAGRAQAALGTAYRCGIKHPGNTARFWPEGWCGDAQGVRGADSGIGDGPERWSAGGNNLQIGPGRSEPHREVEGGRSAVRAHTEEVSVG